MNTLLLNFPTYQRKLSSYERTLMAKTGWCGIDTVSSIEEVERFDESFNHKPCDELNIPRTINQPVDFSI